MPRSAKGLSILLVFAVLACGKDDPADPFGNGGGGSGTFEATVAGSASHTFSGTATFSSVSGVGFVLSLVDTDGGGSLSVHRNNAGRPGTGTFSLGEVSGNQDGMFASGTASGAVFSSVSGTLSIERSSAGSLKGTLQLQATGVTGDSQPGNFTINATFDANCFAVGGSVTCD
jgi:hypothetical protein